MSQLITVHSRWRGKQTQVEVEVSRVRFREVGYIALDKSLSGRVPQWMFLQDFRPVRGKQKPAQNRMNTGDLHDGAERN